jgi:hypothetical protein
MKDEPWFHFRWMLNGFYIWPVRWQGWALVAVAGLGVWGAILLFPLWPGPAATFWIVALLPVALFVWIVSRHAKAHYPDEQR